ncbi:amidase [Iamia sp. SCSIO 61187]|uniref:amidase n=1 Tax=Iamia sp. SCSIO 61187 TaxID=2722752 RepID=UPI001C62C6F5|nr:amidase [Iamia sp. SCSIO 61187]QYG93590.1 amidase [Iamia sp. SCSIO 61187]
MDFREHTVEELAARVRAREVSARELTGAALDRIAALDGAIHAFRSVDPDPALADAELIDSRIADGEDVGPLAGIPIGVKDLEDALGFVTTHGSVLSRDDAPAMGDSIFVARLRAAGCVIVGKTNTPEMGCKGDTTNGLGPPTVNPWHRGRSAGGSSGGSAAAVASGMVPLATGSDGGGSIRIPAAICGLTGFKPSLGRVPVGGPSPPSWADLSAKGPMTRRASDAAAVLDAVVGPDPSDLRSLPRPRAAWRPQLDEPHPPLRVAWSPTLGYAPVDAEVAAVCAAAVERLSGTGCEVVEVPSVFPEDPVGDWLVLTSVSHLRTFGDLRGTPEWELLDRSVRYGIELAADRTTALDVVVAQDTCHQLNQTLTTLLHDVSFLLTPTVAALVPEPDGMGTIDGVHDPNWVRFTYPFNLTRSPAGTVPIGRTADGVPVGLQVIGPQHADAAVLRVLAYLEGAIGVDDVAPVG